MRKRLNLLFAAGLAGLLVLTACGTTEEATEDTGLTVQNTEDTTEAQTDGATEEGQATNTAATGLGPKYTIEKDDSLSGQDGNFTKNLQEKVEITDDNYGTLKSAVDAYYNKLMTEDFEQFKSYYSDELTDIQDDSEDGMTASYDIYSTVARCDDQIFSILITQNVYTGGAHGSNTFLGVNFDVNTGKIITLDDLGNISSEAKAYILNQLSNSPDYAATLFPEYEQTISDDFDDKYDDFSFILDVRGVKYVFQEYDIAPYAAGQVDFTVPYSELTSIKTDYLPKSAFYSFAMKENLHETIALNNDGTTEDLYFKTAYESEDGAELTLYVGDQSMTRDELNAYAYCECYFAHTANGNYVFEVIYDDNNNPTTYLYEVSDGIVLKGQADGLGLVTIHDGTVELATRNTETFSWNDSVTYSYEDNENGFAEIKAVAE